MSKIDASRDYYAELEVEPDASPDQIRKNFHKLAWKYHPDKHPGKEEEYKAKFQAIQAAHEVLGDPEQRQKYDHRRKRGNVRNNEFQRPNPPPRRNPYPTTDFPPPPRPPPPRSRESSTGRSTPSAPTGAERYKDFPRPPRRGEKPAQSNDTRARAADILNAWQHMSHAQKQQAQRAQGYSRAPPTKGGRRPVSGNSPPREREQGNQRPTSEIPRRSAWDQIHRVPPPFDYEANQRASHRKGFNPTTPLGDEGPATASMYASAFRPGGPDRATTGYGPNLPPRAQAPTAKRADPPSRAHSGDDVPFTEGIPRTASPYTSSAGAGEKTAFSSDSLRRSASLRDTTKHPEMHGGAEQSSPREHHSRHRSASPKASRSPDTSDSPNQAFRPFEVYSDDEDEEESNSEAGESGSSTSSANADVSRRDPSQRPKAHPSAKWKNRTGPSSVHRARSFEKRPKAGEPLRKTSYDERRDQSPKTIFPFPINGQTFAPGHTKSDTPRSASPKFESSSAPNIPPSFTKEVDDADAVLESGGRSNSAPERGDAPSQTRSAPLSNEQPSQGNSSQHGPRQEQTSNTGFSADAWNQENWAARWAHHPGGQTSSGKNMPNSRRMRTNVSTSPAGGGGDNSPTSPRTKMPGADANSTTNIVDEDPMDIDPQPPSAEGKRPSIVVSDVSSTSNAPNDGERKSSKDADHYQLPKGVPSPGGKSSPISMKDFRHVTPFNTGTNSNEPLQNLDSLSDSLPFKSQSSNEHPSRHVDTGNSNGTSRKGLPNIPSPPQVPVQFTPHSWSFYLQQMQTYLSDWNSFNTHMVALLQDSALKQREMEKGPEGGMVNNWLGAVGETSSLRGWDSYVRFLEDDETLRKHFSAAFEKHMGTVRVHGRLREQIMTRGFPL